MTIEEYQYYSSITTKLFDYMNGQINVINCQCKLEINMYDLVNGTYGNIRYPNMIIINVGTIIDSWNDDYIRYMNKQDYVGTCIAWAIAHELHHADQLISMIQYNRNPDYKRAIETDVEQASYRWVGVHAREISAIGGFRVVINDLETPALNDGIGMYTKASVKEFYLQTIANVILRDFSAFQSLSVFTDDSLADDIVIVFNDMDSSVVIKSYGNYLIQNIDIFANLAYRYAGYFDTYSITAKVDYNTTVKTDRKIAIVTFTISDSLVYPMIFKK